jgi:hypothetical protein
MLTLQELTRLKVADPSPGDLAWRLVLESMVFQAEAEVRWLDHCESRLARSSYQRQTATPPVSAAVPARSDEVVS